MVQTRRWLVLLAAAVCLNSLPVTAQQVTVSTPLIGINNSYYEHINLGWGFHGGGRGGSWFMNFGGPNSVIPPFGGYNPSNDFRFGLGNNGNGGGFHFNLTASQGSNSTLTMAAPSLTMMNGVRGQFFSGSLRPFVTGLIPVVGDYPVMVPYAEYPTFASPSPPVLISPLAERLERLRHESPSRVKPARPGEAEDALVLSGDAEKSAPIAASSSPSSAERGDISVAEIRQLQALEDQAKRNELARLIEDARAAERAGQLAVARVHYQQAAARATGDQRRELQESLAKLKPQR